MPPLQLHAKAYQSYRTYGTVPGQGRYFFLATLNHLPLGTILMHISVSTFSVDDKGVKPLQNAQGFIMGEMPRNKYTMSSGNKGSEETNHAGEWE